MVILALANLSKWTIASLSSTGATLASGTIGVGAAPSAGRDNAKDTAMYVVQVKDAMGLARRRNLVKAEPVEQTSIASGVSGNTGVHALATVVAARGTVPVQSQSHQSMVVSVAKPMIIQRPGDATLSRAAPFASMANSVNGAIGESAVANVAVDLRGAGVRLQRKRTHAASLHKVKTWRSALVTLTAATLTSTACTLSGHIGVRARVLRMVKRRAQGSFRGTGWATASGAKARSRKSIIATWILRPHLRHTQKGASLAPGAALSALARVLAAH